jgi:hypothetical protein
MDALGGGLGGIWSLNYPFRRRAKHGSKSKSSDSVEATSRAGLRFPLKQAVIAGSLALSGDTIAQLTERWRKAKALNHEQSLSDPDGFSKVRQALTFSFMFFSLFFFFFFVFFVNVVFGCWENVGKVKFEYCEVMFCFHLFACHWKRLSDRSAA